MEMKMNEPILEFQGEYRFLSNFWPAEVHFEGEYYPSVEHAYVAAKTLDPTLRKQFQSGSPGAVKRAGRQLQLRPDWEEVKLTVMRRLLYLKFQNPELREKLLATGERELVEGNNWSDFYWGVCRGKGQNHLGRLLMEVRAELRK